jgi:hypothetical protein
LPDRNGQVAHFQGTGNHCGTFAPVVGHQQGKEVVGMERISAFMDGEVEESEVTGQVRRMKEDPRLRAVWDTYHLIGDTLRGEKIGLSQDFTAKLGARLAEEPTILAPRSRTPLQASARRFALPVAASLGGAALVAWLFAMPSRQIRWRFSSYVWAGVFMLSSHCHRPGATRGTLVEASGGLMLEPVEPGCDSETVFHKRSPGSVTSLDLCPFREPEVACGRLEVPGRRLTGMPNGSPGFVTVWRIPAASLWRS